MYYNYDTFFVMSPYSLHLIPKWIVNMKFEKLINELSIESKDLYYKLIIVFAFFFMAPVLGFVYYSFKYNLLNDRNTPIIIAGIMISTFFGYSMLRQLFDEIKNISHRLSTSDTIAEVAEEHFGSNTGELRHIVNSFNLIERQLVRTNRQLESRASEISILKELSELCYVTFDPLEILYVTLERSLTITESDMGSIMTIDRGDAKKFIITASIGLGENVKLGEKIDFDSSIAKYAVINKSPLVVEDVEKDSRFGRTNRPHYGTKSFVCMPIKTSKNIIGVLTISRRDNAQIYSHKDIEPLTPLLSNAAFTYENLRLLNENKQSTLYLKSIEKFYTIVNSSLRGNELINSILSEIQSIISFDVAVVMIIDKYRADHIIVFDFLASGPTDLTKGATFPIINTTIDKVIKQNASEIVEDINSLKNKNEKTLFTGNTCKAVLYVPLKMDGTVKGVVALSASRLDVLHEAKQPMEWIANGLALSIERGSLLDAVDKGNLERETIRQIGKTLASSTFDMNKVLNFTMDLIKEIMNIEAGSLLMLEKDELKFAVAFNLDVKSLKKIRLKLGQGIAGSVAHSGDTIIENDVKHSPYFFPEIDKAIDFETRSSLCVPMISHGKVIGVISLLNKKDGDFNLKDKDLLQSISASVSIAIENARLYKETVSMAENERNIRHMFQKFVPKEIVDKITRDTDTGQEVVDEIKTLTLINIDIRSFSVMSKELGPQKTVFLLNNFFGVMGGIVFKHNGIVDKYLGDGFLAIFGAPVSSTADADNAVAAALEMQESVEYLNEYLETKLGTLLKVGISIHTGEAVAGNFGFAQKMDYTVIGDSVNNTFKMQEFTKPFTNGILVSERTCNAVTTKLNTKETDKAVDGMKIYQLFPPT